MATAKNYGRGFRDRRGTNAASDEDVEAWMRFAAAPFAMHRAGERHYEVIDGDGRVVCECVRTETAGVIARVLTEEAEKLRESGGA